MPPALRYAAALTAITLAVSAVFVVVAGTPDRRAVLLIVIAGVVGVSFLQAVTAFRRVPLGRRVRQQFRLTSRSWIECESRWTPVHFDPSLLTGEPVRLYRSGRVRRREPPGKLIDNPVRPSADAPERARAATRIRRRLTLDGQQALAAPLIGFFWVYLDGGGLPVFLAATLEAAAVIVWLAAIRGSDPS